MKTIIYVDGYKLFYGCLKNSPYKWLDLYKLFAQQILYAQDPLANVVQIKYFTANIKAKIARNGKLAEQAQHAYHRALAKLYPSYIQIIKGSYSLERARLPLFRNPPDKNQSVEVWKLEEKETDVNIALTSYRDVVRGAAEVVVFVSNDTDLTPALAAIREDFGEKLKIGVIIPVRKGDSGRPANARLSLYADWTRKYITPEELLAAQLPSLIPTGKKPINKPGYW